MEYTVSVAIDGRIAIKVDADSFEEAKRKALTEVAFSDLDTMEIVGTSAVNAERADGEFRDY